MRRALLLSGALLLTACGGGDDAKKEYVDSATKVCKEAAEQRDALTQPTAPADFADYVNDLVTIAEKAQADLQALEPPSEDKDELEKRVLDPFGQLVEEGRQFAEKVEAAGGDQSKLFPLLSQIPDPKKVDLEYLRSYGLDTCADIIDLQTS